MRQLLPIKSGAPKLWCRAFYRGSPVSERVRIVPVQSKAQWRDFHHLPFKIYRDDPHWVAPLLLERQFHFHPKHNPYFQHARAAFFLAYRGPEPAGPQERGVLERHAATLPAPTAESPPGVRRQR